MSSQCFKGTKGAKEASSHHHSKNPYRWLYQHSTGNSPLFSHSASQSVEKWFTGC